MSAFESLNVIEATAPKNVKNVAQLSPKFCCAQDSSSTASEPTVSTYPRVVISALALS
jgi:hypothetical protein